MTFPFCYIPKKSIQREREREKHVFGLPFFFLFNVLTVIGIQINNMKLKMPIKICLIEASWNIRVKNKGFSFLQWSDQWCRLHP